MCGIAGLLLPSGGKPGVAPAAADVRAMLATMEHRGPDADGLWEDSGKRCVLGHRRLSIIDTSDAGRQPLASSDGRWIVTFNGEIYNYRELSPLLASAGMAPKGRTDTEVLANAIAVWGTDALDKLDGQFAFAAFDTLSGRLILARDPFGEKPLYFLHTEVGGIAFASELQALEHLSGFKGEVSADAVAELLMFQYVGAPRTIYKNVRKLEPGHWMVIDPGRAPRTGRYFRFAPGAQGFTDRPLPELVDELEGLLARSIERRMIADVPLGAFLSGGVDSSTVCALVTKKLGRPLETFSIGFKGSRESEHLAARRFASILGTQHFDRILAPSASEFLRGIGDLLDEPNADSSCMPTYLLSQFARKRVTVALSGDGGDEMFGGYGRYFDTLDEARSRSGGSWSAGSAYYADRILIFTDPLIRDLMGELPAGLAEHLGGLRRDVDQGEAPLYCRLRRTDVENYMPGAVLPKVDRMSMRHSLEVRTPYLNVDLARFAERLPESMIYRSGRGKLLLRELAYRYLPRDLVDAPKRGFGLPMSRWARGDLLRATRDLLLSEESRLRAALGSDAMEAFVRRQHAWRGFATYQVWALGMLESWLRRHPARTEEFADTVKAARDRGKPPRLRAVRLGRGIYAMFESKADSGESALSDAERTQLAGVMSRVYLSSPEQWAFDPKAPMSSSAELTLPGWGRALLPSDLAAAHDLEGACVLLPHPDAAQKLDYFELDRLRNLGIRRLVFLNPNVFHRPAVQLEMRRHARGRRTANGLRLFSRATRLRWRPRIRAFLDKRASGSADRMYSSEVLRGVEDAGGELGGRYMLYEGLRQMPPVPVSHAAIAKWGRGRYSIWSRQCHYSPTRTRRLLALPYWIVERTPQRDGLLEFVPTAGEREAADIPAFGRLLDELVTLRNGETVDEPGLAPGEHVALVTHALTPGGAERQWCYLAQALKSAGFKVSFLVTSIMAGDGAHHYPLLASAGIEPIQLGSAPIEQLLANVPKGPVEEALLAPNVNPFGAVLALVASTLRMLKPKAVFAQLDAVNILTGAAALAANVPRVVLSFRNYSPARFPYLHETWFLPAYQALAKSRRVVLTGNSRMGNGDYASWLGVPERTIALVPNAVEPSIRPISDEQGRALRQALGIPAQAPVILGVFRLSEEKRPELFVDVCAGVIERRPDVRALIVGIGPMADAIGSLIHARGLDGRVRLLGRRTDVDALMKISTLLLLTSEFEGMPNVLLEAQSEGLPVVASNVGGVGDCVADGRSGFLVPAGSRDEFVARCLQLIGDKDAAATMGQSGKDHMRTFSKESLAQRFVALAGDGAQEATLSALAQRARS